MEHDTNVVMSFFFIYIIEKPTKEPVKPIKEQPIIESGKSQWTQLLLHA